MTALILCHNRPAEVVATVESLDTGFREVVVLDNASAPPLPELAGVRLRRSDENTGVATGRNLLLDACTTDFAVFIDDDAVALTPLAEAVAARFAAAPDLAVIAFRIDRPDGGVSLEYPYRGPRPDDDSHRSGPCAYFVGAGYAVRVAAVKAVGGYDDAFFYSNEEIDLAMALIGAGWRLEYHPDLVVEHRPSAEGRNPNATIDKMVLRNRIVYARRHLRTPVRQVHCAFWMGRTLPGAVRSRELSTWTEAIREGVRRDITPAPLSWPQHRDAHRLGGRVLY